MGSDTKRLGKIPPLLWCGLSAGGWFSPTTSIESNSPSHPDDASNSKRGASRSWDGVCWGGRVTLLKTSACLGIQEETPTALPLEPMPPATGDESKSTGAERRTSGPQEQLPGEPSNPGLTWGRGPSLRPTRGDSNLRGPHQARSSKPSTRSQRRPAPVAPLYPFFGATPLLALPGHRGMPPRVEAGKGWRVPYSTPLVSPPHL